MLVRIGLLSAALIAASAALPVSAHAGSWRYEGHRHWLHQDRHLHRFHPPRSMAFHYGSHPHRYVYVLPPRVSYWERRRYCR
jgi:hypothetical protein